MLRLRDRGRNRPGLAFSTPHRLQDRTHPMPRTIFASLLAVAAMTLLAPTLRPDSARADHHEKDEAMKNEKLLRHVVLFRFKDDASEDQIKKVEQAFAQLPQKIDVIHDFEYGTNNSPEDLARGYTHCFLVTFKSEDDRAKYLPHPAHKAFVEVLKPTIDEVHVIDYWAKTSAGE